MKKTIATISLLLGVVFLSGCSDQGAISQTQPAAPNPVAQNPTTNQPPTASAEKKVAADFSCGKSQVKDASGITYGTIVTEDGKCWLDRNLGATEVATSSTDEKSYGWYFQWGRGADGHQIPTSDTTSTMSSFDNPGHAKFIADIPSPYDWRSPQNDKLWQGVSGINNPCPDGFRLPTQAEWMSLISAAKIEDAATAFSSSLKLSVAGNRGRFIPQIERGSWGTYWSSDVTGTGAFCPYFSSKGVDPVHYDDRAEGCSVRCLKN